MEDLRKYVERLHGELIALRRLVVESNRDFGILQNVTTLDEFKKHWGQLKQTDEGKELIAQWILRAVTRKWITTEKFDEIWDATLSTLIITKDTPAE
jgi:hypothetical protein